MHIKWECNKIVPMHKQVKNSKKSKYAKKNSVDSCFYETEFCIIKLCFKLLMNIRKQLSSYKSLALFIKYIVLTWNLVSSTKYSR